ncbi:ribosome maturation factor RimM [Phenylobacterium montanum]|uniref:Ribosome maturation factor RimM n=1 Tax=Phenylobacterium montanum TaxID=2823693 RepID=A0A975FWZ8_9CAUL|nr:ribosome maturation factor RimM [Caulobacter sp. S6]QUD86691.1 16S rRNA processing protein RimM [Caulobacter sp. S6]
MTNLILVGQVAGAFGVRGEVKITAFTESPANLLSYKTLKRQDGSPGLTLTSGRVHKGQVIGRAKEVATREEAEALRGLKLFIPRETLPQPDEDEFYLTDLIGLAAVSPEGAAVGRIKSVQNFGAGDLLEIEPPAGPTWWLPFTRDCVPEVDLAGCKVVVARPDEVGDEEPGAS